MGLQMWNGTRPRRLLRLLPVHGGVRGVVPAPRRAVVGAMRLGLAGLLRMRRVQGYYYYYYYYYYYVRRPQVRQG